jgi:hypothetical protein
MDERHYITVEEEQAEQAKSKAAEGFAAFLSQWNLEAFPGQLNLETVPACDAGMRLLYAFALAQPKVFDLIKSRGFIADEPRLKNSPHWRAFSEHVQTCPKCNEIGASH